MYQLQMSFTTPMNQRLYLQETRYNYNLFFYTDFVPFYFFPSDFYNEIILSDSLISVLCVHEGITLGI